MSKYEETMEAEASKTFTQATLKALGRIWRWGKEIPKIKAALKNYQVNYQQKFGKIKVLGMHHELDLSRIYTAVRLSDTNHLQAYADERSLEETFRSQGRRMIYGQRSESQDGIAAANNEQRLCVLGQPGAGKTTFLRRLGQEALVRMSIAAGNSGDSTYAHECLPVLIELRTYRFEEKTELLKLLQKQLDDWGFPNSESFLKKNLPEGKFLILLDGLDEVPQDHLPWVIEQVRTFENCYPDNRYVLSCRTAFYHHHFAKFRTVVMMEFSDEQIARFVRNWFSDAKQKEAGTADKLLKLLQQESHATVRELAQTPLLLTFLCLKYETSQSLPPNRAQLFKSALEILLERWAAEKIVHNEGVYAGLHAEMEVDMLAEIASKAFAGERFFLLREEITDGIRDFMARESNAPKNLDARKILEEVEKQQGLIVKRTENLWSFSHLTLQEYLTAHYLHKEGGWEDIVDRHLYDTRWREVFLLLAGMGQAGGLLKRMASQNKRLLLEKAPQWEKCFNHVRKACVPASESDRVEEKTLVKVVYLGFICAFALDRALAFAIELNHARDLALALALARDLACNLDGGLAFALDRTLAFALDLDRTLDLNLDRALARDGALARTCARDLAGFLLSHDIIHPHVGRLTQELLVRYQALSQEGNREEIQREYQALGLPTIEAEHEAQAMQSYLGTARLIVDCKKASSRLANNDWQEVLSLIL